MYEMIIKFLDDVCSGCGFTNLFNALGTLSVFSVFCNVGNMDSDPAIDAFMPLNFSSHNAESLIAGFTRNPEFLSQDMAAKKANLEKTFKAYLQFVDRAENIAKFQQEYDKIIKKIDAKFMHFVNFENYYRTDIIKLGTDNVEFIECLNRFNEGHKYDDFAFKINRDINDLLLSCLDTYRHLT